MDKNMKKKIILITIIAYALIIGLLVLIASSLKKNVSSENGLFKSDKQMIDDAKPQYQTEQDRLDEYESREEMPEVTEESFYESINQFLSSGNLNELDKTLRRWQETYKDSSSEDESKAAVINQYRGDLAYYWAISANNKALDIWQFKLPDTLASCIAYTPIMQKYKAFINQNSVLFPAVDEGSPINLSKSIKTSEELNAIRDDINRTRTDENAFQQIAVYDLTLYNYPCEFIAVMDRETMTWMPYSLKVTNNMVDLPTVAIGKEIIKNNEKADLDAIIAVPAMIAERPDGMTGNIDYSQNTTPGENTNFTTEKDFDQLSDVPTENQDSNVSTDEAFQPAGNIGPEKLVD